MAKRRTQARPSNFDLLRRAGVLEPRYFTEKQKKLIDERLTKLEVGILIRLRRKMGAPLRGNPHVRPFFFV